MELHTDREKTAHLLRRFGLGASEAELDFYSQKGLPGAIDTLLNYESTDDGFGVPIQKFRAGIKSRVTIQGVQQWWVLRLLATRRPLQEKMALFWHDHFATSAEKVKQPVLMYQQNQVIRDNATGAFKTLLSGVSKDPAMIVWLDNEFNVAGKANENFAREVMELFTLGIGHYTEKDVQESARAFTGWSFRRVSTDEDQFGNGGKTAEFFERERLHDDGPKTYLGQSGNFDGDDIIGILCGNRQTARFLTQKIWNWFVYENPEPSLVERLASDWYAHDLDIKYLLRSIMESDEFYSDRAARRLLKNPADFVIAPMRQLGVGPQIVAAVKSDEAIDGPNRQILAICQRAMQTMGMNLLFPPDVSGWKPGKAWISTATMVQRMQFAYALFGPQSGASTRPNIRFDTFPMFKDQPNIEGVVRKLASIFDAGMDEGKLRQLTHRAMEVTQGELNESNSNQIAAMVSSLLFVTPEYQFC